MRDTQSCEAGGDIAGIKKTYRHRWVGICQAQCKEVGSRGDGGSGAMRRWETEEKRILTIFGGYRGPCEVQEVVGTPRGLHFALIYTQCLNIGCACKGLGH